MCRLVCFLLTAAALAPTPADADAVNPLTVAVGETIEQAVGYARGVICDDLETVGVAMRTAGDTNYLVLTGKREGRTLCRVGTDLNRVSYFFEITVTPEPPLPRRS